MKWLPAACAAFALVSGQTRVGGPEPPTEGSPRESGQTLEPYTFSTQRGEKVDAEVGPLPGSREQSKTRKPVNCRAVNVSPLGRESSSPVRSDVPVLFISGNLDGQTPPRRAEEIARGFSRGSTLIVPGASHGFDLFYLRPEVKTAMLEFLTSR